ncbi:hypothetical protein N7537_000942 [Penicillium hordei]|uniref:Secreted protein n=1 Tax=Penicillium hordei TaxID=40994 RepID=A0AAD6EEK6_9EURO|nr:uncharacterized protein N7537_000942 [Penicillium hordei]KAJ5615828.1 hypothetical protein N7537_000942 [Penicillium hordei]
MDFLLFWSFGRFVALLADLGYASMAGTHCTVDAITALEEHNAKKPSKLGHIKNIKLPNVQGSCKSMADGKPLSKETPLLCAYSAAVQIAYYG